MKTKKPIAIIGAGIAGLTAADYLNQRGEKFILFEAGKKIAGLATSFKDDEGFSHDFGAHFITNRLADAIGIGSECHTVKYYGESVWLDGKTYRYPFGLVRIPRMMFSGIISKVRSMSNGRKVQTAAEWFRSRYGNALADEVALPLIEAWSGTSADQLSTAVGESLPGSIAKTLYLKAAGNLTGRAVACGYNREMTEKASVYHVYPKKGVSALCEKLAEGLADKIKLETPVETILVENGRVESVKAKGEIYQVSAVISTAPAHILEKLVSGSDVLRELARFRYRPMTFVNMRFSGRNILPDTVLWFPEDDFTFFRLTEAPISMPWLAPEGKTILTVDIGCEKDDPIWSMDKEQLAELCLEQMSSLFPDIRSRYLGSTVIRTPVAYPVYHLDYETARKNFEQRTGIENLLSVGRNGEFSHIFMEDVYWRTRNKIEQYLGN